MNKFVGLFLCLFLMACAGGGVRATAQMTTVKPSTPALVTRKESAAATAILAATKTDIADLKAEICRSAEVSAEIGAVEEKNSAVTMSVDLTNRANAACVAPFYADVRLTDASGTVLNVERHTFKELSNSGYYLVEAGQSVGFLLVWKNWCGATLPGGVKIQMKLAEDSQPVEVSTAGTDLEKNTIYAGAACTQAGQKSELWVGQLVNTVPVPLEP